MIFSLTFRTERLRHRNRPVPQSEHNMSFLEPGSNTPGCGLHPCFHGGPGFVLCCTQALLPFDKGGTAQAKGRKASSCLFPPVLLPAPLGSTEARFLEPSAISWTHKNTKEVTGYVQIAGQLGWPWVMNS